MEFERGKKVRTHLDIAPLIDIVFLLLIFFMLTANFIMQPGIKIKLPEAENARPEENNKIVIYISENNDIFLNGTKISVTDLKNTLGAELGKSDKKTVILKADEKINLGLAVKVMDISKESGAEGLVISTKLEEKLRE